MTRIVQLQRGFWISIAVAMAWISIPQGIYSIVQGSIDFFAILNIVLGISLIILAFVDSVTAKLTSLSIGLWRIAAFLVVFLFFGLSQAFRSTPSFSISMAEQSFLLIYRLVTVLTMLIVLWQLVRSVREPSVSAN